MPDFLDLTERSAKPREAGLTHVIDTGSGLAELEDQLEGSAAYVDIVKLGFGTAYVDPRAPEKVRRLRARGIGVCLGGTLLEAAVLAGKVPELRAWALETGFDMVEVSTGTVELELGRKLALIEQLARDFKVLSEVGSKDVDVVMAPYRWVHAIEAELGAGAWKVVAEGRESGNAGLFRRNGEVRHGLVEEIVAAVDPRLVLFEAPRTEQQGWFIRTLGPEVNLGNIAWKRVIALETLRRGLRNDTLLELRGPGGAIP